MAKTIALDGSIRDFICRYHPLGEESGAPLPFLYRHGTQKEQIKFFKFHGE